MHLVTWPDVWMKAKLFIANYVAARERQLSAKDTGNQDTYVTNNNVSIGDRIGEQQLYVLPTHFAHCHC